MGRSSVWRRTFNYQEIDEIFCLCEPAINVWDREGITTYDPDLYRTYVYEEKNKILAIGIGSWLPKTRVFHIETFALHPDIRGQGRARSLYQSWRRFVRKDWAETISGDDTTMIEVYVYNVEAWRKIMGVVELDHNLKDTLRTPAVLMGKNVRNVNESYQEYLHFKGKWISSLNFSTVPSCRSNKGYS
ncbi:Hypothetical protein HVR_LOCUS1020 [uncultured virus]|nr:Hypothetical protein HVR_LOCUS1020 [uncultured virus]